MSKKKKILLTISILVAIFAIGEFFLISQYKNEKVLVEQSQFEIKIPQDDGDFISTGITSKNIEEVYIALTANNTEGLVIVLDEEGKNLFNDITTKNKGEPLGFFIDDVIISLPRIQKTVQNGTLVITHDFTNNDLLNLKARLLGYFYLNSREYKDFEFSDSLQYLNIEIDSVDKTEATAPVGQTKVRASHILICYKDSIGCDDLTLSKEDALKKINELKLLATPENFTEMAINNSTNPTAKDNMGDLGWLAKGETPEPFEDAVFNADVGQIVGPIETDYGFHLIYKTGEK